MSLLGKYPCDNITAPTYLSFSTASCTALISIVASVGNFLVVLAVFLNPNKDLRSPFNCFIANLGFCRSCCWTCFCSYCHGVSHLRRTWQAQRAVSPLTTHHIFHPMFRFASQSYSFGVRSLCGDHIPSDLQSQAEPNSSACGFCHGLDSFHCVIPWFTSPLAITYFGLFLLLRL